MEVQKQECEICGYGEEPTKQCPSCQMELCSDCHMAHADDISSEGMELIRDIVTIYDNYGYPTQVLTASARGPLHVRDAALCGAHVVTLPYPVFEKLFDHPLTDSGLEQFLADYRKSQER